MFYRRTLPHLQRDNKRHFVTFCTRDRWTLPNLAREIILSSSLHDDGFRYDLDAAVVMPDHAHLILTPLINQAEARVWLLPEILDAIKGASAHVINRKRFRRDLFGRKSHSTMCCAVRNKYAIKSTTSRRTRFAGIGGKTTPGYGTVHLQILANPGGRGRPPPRRAKSKTPVAHTPNEARLRPDGLELD